MKKVCMYLVDGSSITASFTENEWEKLYDGLANNRTGYFRINSEDGNQDLVNIAYVIRIRKERIEE